MPRFAATALDLPALAPYRDVGEPARLTAQGLFVAEGRLVVERLVALDRYRLHSLLLTDAAAAALAPTLARLPDAVPVYVASHDVMNGVVGFNIHRGCLALAARPAAAPLVAADLETRRRVLVLDGVSNPDNVGGLFRVAAALGVELLILGPNSGDPLYRKAIRTSMGAALSLPWRQVDALPPLLESIRAAGWTTVAATPAPDAPSLYDAALPARAAVLVGAEGPGLTPAVLACADRRVRIPMHGGMDSLNVVTAAAIVLSALDRVIP